MKWLLLVILIGLIPYINFAQSQDSIKIIGVAINSGVNGEFYLFQVVPGVVYSKGKSQQFFEEFGFSLAFQFNIGYRF